ncbi:hypothetical protein BpHYR1_026945 [Brachionus plicatilis]|uniref:Uncharacterized protein n=1 Tax=Brachionus plicatilis TaxID=10195 RepID=A0A3M7P9C4_BRAPC|nr:hypothetical protein BpHYR1_026945 [Brachionus plicatilis]
MKYFDRSLNFCLDKKYVLTRQTCAIILRIGSLLPVFIDFPKKNSKNISNKFRMWLSMKSFEKVPNEEAKYFKIIVII